MSTDMRTQMLISPSSSFYNDPGISTEKIEEESNDTFKITIFYFALSGLCQGIGTFLIKLCIILYTTDFNVTLFLFFRSLILVILTFIYASMENIEINLLPKLGHQQWIILKGILTYISLVISTISLIYLRCTTVQNIYSLIPYFVLILAHIFFGNKLSIKKVIIITLTIGGLIIVILGEFKDLPKDDYYNIFKGLFYGLLSLIIFSSNSLVNIKIQFKNISSEVMLINIHLIIMLICFAVLILQFIFTKVHINKNLIVLSLIHGANYGLSRLFNLYALKDIKIKNFGWINSFRTIIVMIIAWLFLNEKLHIFDWIGSFIIISLIIYEDLFSPAGKKI